MGESAVADEIGRIGESYFDYQMSQTDLLVGKIDPDRMGKDRVIEAKLAPRNNMLSFDKRPAPMACSIQIKTILSSTKVVNVSLSVAERLAQGLSPAFVYIVRLDDDRKPTEVRIIHILGKALGKVLKRLRKEFSKGTTEYKDKSITFPIKEAKTIGLLGHDLSRYLNLEIGPDMDEYIEKKRMQKRDLGYENGKRTTVTGSFGAAAINDFIDGMLGLKPLTITALKAEDERFGIYLPVPSFPKFQPGLTAQLIPKPSARCTLVLGPTHDAAEIVCDVTFPPMGTIPLEFFKARLKSPILEATFSRDEFQVSTKPFATSDRRTIAEWIACYTIIVGVSSVDGLPIGLRTPIGVEHLGIAKGGSPADDMEAEYTLRLLKAMRSLRAEADVEDRPVMLDDVYLMASYILRAQKCIAENFRDDVTFSLASPTDEKVPRDVEVVIISGFTLGDEYYVHCSNCAMQSSVVNGLLAFSQSGPLTFLEASTLDDFDGDLKRYQRKAMRMSRSNLCVTFLTEGTHDGELTEIGDPSDHSATSPQLPAA
ncbi:hypothetical protein [Pararhizobium gei]|uniref:hypothetical protein n=1 Tax=Pararhizobium gei TaxID=1395951 RepID=UPI0023DBED3E|nr:hypothetical protein [Rhizobium gei]